MEGPDPERIVAVSIMRSGDALLDVVRDIEPAVRVGKILIQRDESTIEKKAKLFYCKVPSDIARQNVLLCDPMLATGGSALKAIEVQYIGPCLSRHWRGPHRSPKPGGSYETGSDGAAGWPPGPNRVPTGLPAACGAAVGALGVRILVVHRYGTVE